MHSQIVGNLGCCKFNQEVMLKFHEAKHLGVATLLVRCDLSGGKLQMSFEKGIIKKEIVRKMQMSDQ